jgi:hypothetical protein
MSLDEKIYSSSNCFFMRRWVIFQEDSWIIGIPNNPGYRYLLQCWLPIKNCSYFTSWLCFQVQHEQPLNILKTQTCLQKKKKEFLPFCKSTTPLLEHQKLLSKLRVRERWYAERLPVPARRCGLCSYAPRFGHYALLPQPYKAIPKAQEHG